MILHLNAGHDRNGNPRRVYVLIREVNGYSFVAGAWNEGYAGHHVVPAEYQHQAAMSVMIKVPVSEYRAMLKQGVAALKSVA